MDSQIFIELKEYITTVFANNGFQFENRKVNDVDNFIINFTKEKDHKKELVIVDFQTDPQHQNIAVNFIGRIRLDIIERFIPQEFRIKVRDLRPEIYTIKTFGDFLEGQRLHDIETIEQNTELFKERLELFISNSVLSSLENYKNLKELNSEVNKDINSFSPLLGQTYLFNKVIISLLCDSNDSSNIYSSVMDQQVKYLEEAPSDRDKIYFQNCVDLLLHIHSAIKDIGKIDYTI